MNENRSDMIADETIPKEKFDHIFHLDWMIPVGINIFLTVVTMWMLISLIHYGVKMEKWKKSSGRHSDKLNAGVVYSFVIVCAIMCLLRYIASLLFMNIGFEEGKDLFCDIVADIAYASYALVLSSVVFFLWFRQRNFYANKMFGIVYSFWIRILSFGSIFVIACLGIFVVVYNVFPLNYKSSKHGCVYQPNSSLQPSYWISAVVIITTNHITMLGLFAYALIHLKRLESNELEGPRTSCDRRTERTNSDMEKKSLKNAKRSVEKSVYGSRISSTAIPGSSKKIQVILKKTLFFAILSIASDILAQVVAQYIVDPEGHRRISFVIFDINAFLNLLCLMMSFVTFKDMLVSPCMKRNY